MDTDLPPEAFGVLNKIASGEAPAYNIMYGGSTFSSYRDHPRIVNYTPEGVPTTAAGRYQFLSRTWDDLAIKLGLKDFSPHNQDIAAWNLANNTYKEKTNRDLATDASAGRVEWGALAGQWPSLAVKAKGGSAAPPSSQGSPEPPKGGQTPNVDSLVASGLMPGDNQLAPKGTPGQTSLPLLAMVQLLAPNHKVSQVDYDPWKVAPKLNGGVGG